MQCFCLLMLVLEEEDWKRRELKSSDLYEGRIVGV